ncbi:MAG: hypothetical protein ABJE95_27430 [Byssovorax sp.]
MNLGASAIVLRPRALAETLDLACRLSCSLALGLYLRLSAVVLLPCFAGCLALRYALECTWTQVWMVAITLGAITQGVFTVAIGRLLFSEVLTTGGVLRLFGKRLGSYLGMLVLSRAILAMAALPFFLGLPFVWPRLLVVHEASLLEGAGPGDAVARANRFIVGRNLSAFLAIVAFLALHAGISITAELLGQGLVNELLQLGTPFGELFKDGGSPFALAGFFLAVPYLATARFLYYVDSRTRSDGWDVQVRFMAIAALEAQESRQAA